MYRVYLRTFDQQVREKTNTPNQQAALDAFTEMVNRTDLDGKKLAAVITYNNQQLAFHRFDLHPGDMDYWRGRIEEINLSNTLNTHGGPGRGQGLKAADGATGLKRVNISINTEHMAILRDFGDGKLSLGIRRAADAIAKHHLITK